MAFQGNYNVLSANAPVFGGKVIQVPVSTADEFYFENASVMSDSAIRSYFRSFSIPQSFFMELPVEVQKQALAAQRVLKLGSVENLLMCVSDAEDRILYVAPESSMGCGDPADTLGLTGTDGWFMEEVDWDRGVISYVKLHQDAAGTLLPKHGMYPAIFCRVPIFYSRQIEVEAGMFRVAGSLALIDNVNSTKLKLDPLGCSKDVVTSVMNGVSEILIKADEAYTKFYDYMTSTSVTAEELNVIMEELKVFNRVPKSLLVRLQRYLDRLAKGLDIAPELPQQVTNYKDFMTAGMVYVKDFSSVYTKARMEASIFGYFMGKAVASGMVSKTSLELSSGTSPAGDTVVVSDVSDGSGII